MKESLIVVLLICILAVSQGQVTEGTCLMFSIDGQSCIKCKSHYHLHDGQCYVDINGCSSYFEGNICKKCQEGYILVNNECCDKHCMAKIFRKFHAQTLSRQNTEEKHMQKITLQGYQRSISLLARMFFANGESYQVGKTNNQRLEGVVRYNLDIIVGREIFRAIVDYRYISNKVELIEYRNIKEFSQVSQKILLEGDIDGEDKYTQALKYVNNQFGSKIYGLVLARLSGYKYRYATEMKFIYTGEKNVIIITIVVNSQNQPYTLWYDQNTNLLQIQQLIKQTKKIEKLEKEEGYKIIKRKIAETHKVAIANIIVTNANKKNDRQYVLSYTNSITHQKYQYQGKYNPETKEVATISEQETINQDIQSIKLPKQPQLTLLTKNEINSNSDMKDVFKYLSEVKPSFNAALVENVQIENMESTTKISIIKKKDGQRVRTVVLKDNINNQFKLVDESIMKQQATNTVYLETKNNDGSKTIITNSLDQIKTSDHEIQSVINDVKTNHANMITNDIQTIQSIDGIKSTEYTFITKHESIASIEKQVTVVHNKENKNNKIIDFKEIIVKEAIQQPIQIPSVTLTPQQIQSDEIKKLLDYLKDKNPQLVSGDAQVVNVKKQITSVEDRYVMQIKSKDKTIISVVIGQDIETKSIYIEDIRPIKEVQYIEISNNIINVSTKTQISQIDGVTTITTNDPNYIKQSQTIQILNDLINDASQQGCQISSVEIQQYTQNFEQKIVFVCKNKTATQNTIIINKKTSQVTPIAFNQQPITDITKPQMSNNPSVTISQPNFKDVVKTDLGLQKIVQTINSKNPSLQKQTPINTVIQDLFENKKYTLIYSNNGMKDRVIAIYNTNTQSTNILQISKIAQNIETVTSTVEVNKQGKTVLTTNSVKEAKRMDQNVDKVISQIKSKHPEIKIEEIQTIQTVQQSATKQYTVIANTVDAKIEQITVSMSKQTKIIREIDLQIVNQQKLIITPLPLPKIEVKPKDYKNEEVSSLLQTIVIKQTSTVGNNPQIVKVEMQESYNEIAYTFILKNQQSKIDYTVKIQKDKTTDETIIADVRPTNNLQIIQKPVQQTYTETTVDQNTGVVITKTNDKETITSSQQTKNAITYLEKNVKEVKGLTVESIETRDYQITTQQTILYRVSENKGIQYTVLIQKSNQQITPIGNTEVDLVNDITKPSLPQIVQNVVTQSSFNVAVTNDKALTSAINVVGSTKPILKTEIPITTIIEDLSQFKKITLVYDVQGNKERITLIHNILTKSSKIVQSSKILSQIQHSISIIKKDQNFKTVTITNNINIALGNDQSIKTIISKLGEQYPYLNQNNIKTIQTKDQTNNKQYNLLFKSTIGQIQQISVSQDKTTSQIKIIDNQIIPIGQSLTQPGTIPKIVLHSKDYQSTQIIAIKKLIQQTQTLGLGKSSEILKIQAQNTPISTIYSIIMKTADQKSYQFKVYKDKLTSKIQLVDQRPSQPHQIVEKPIIPCYTQTIIESGTGVKIIQTNDRQVIKNDLNIVNAVQYVSKNVNQVSTLTVQSVQTRNYELSIEVTLLYKNNDQEGIQVTTIINKQSQQIIKLGQSVIKLTPGKPALPKIPEVTITQHSFEHTKNDDAISNVITKIRNTNSKIENMIPLITKIQQLQQTKKITMLFSTNQIKQRYSVIYNVVDSSSTIVDHLELTSELQPSTSIEIVNEFGKKIVQSNNIENTKKNDQDLTAVINELIKRYPEVNFQSIMNIQVVDQTASTIYTLLAKNKEGKNQQITTSFKKDNKQIKVIDDQIFLRQQQSFIKPTINTGNILESQQLSSKQIISLLDILNKAQPIKVSVGSKILNAIVKTTLYSTRYVLTTENSKGQRYQVQIEKSIQTGDINILGIGTILKKQPIVTKAQVDQLTGTTQTLTTDRNIIQKNPIYKKIRDYLQSRHTQLKGPFVVQSSIEKPYMRSTEETYIFRNGDKLIQSTILVDSRTKQIIELDYRYITQKAKDNVVDIPKDHPQIHITKKQFPLLVQSTPIIKKCIDFAQKTDFTLKGKIPKQTILEDFKVIKKITFVYETQTRNDRIVIINDESKDTRKVVDLGRIPKSLSPSITISTTDNASNKVIISSNIQLIQQNDKFIDPTLKAIYQNDAYLKQHTIKTIQTIQRSKVNQYIIVFISKDELYMTQATVIYDKTTKAARIIDLQQKSFKAQLPQFKTVQFMEVKVSQQNLNSKQILQVKSFIESQSNDIIGQINKIMSVIIKQHPLISYYEVELTSKNGTVVKVSIQKDQKSRKLDLIDIKSSKPVVYVEQRVKQSTTQVKVDSITGVKVTSTTDQQQIRKNPWISDALKKIQQGSQQLADYYPLSVIEKQYQNNNQYTVVFTKQTHQLQITVIIDKKTGLVTKIGQNNAVVLTHHQLPNVEQIKFSQAAYPQVIKTDQIFKNIINAVKIGNPTLNNKIPFSTTIEQQLQNKKVTLIYTNKGITQRVVAIYNKVAQTTKIIDSTTLSTPIKPFTTINQVTENGQNVLTTNDISTYATKDSNFNNILKQIKNKYVQVDTTKIKTVNTVEQSNVVTYTIIGVTNNQRTLQVTLSVDKKTKQFKFIDSRPIPNQQSVLILPVCPFTTEVKSQQYNTPSVKGIIDTISKSKPQIYGLHPTIVSIEKQQTALIKNYQVTLKNKEGENIKVTVQNNPLNTINTIIDETLQHQIQKIQVKVSQTISVKIINPDTGVIITKTNDQTIINQSDQSRNVIQFIKQNVKEIQNCTVLSAEKQIHQENDIESILYKCDDFNTIQVTVLFDKITKNIRKIGLKKIKLDNKQTKITLPNNPSVTISQPNFKDVVKTDLGLQKIVQTINSKNPSLQKQTPINTVIQDLFENKKYTLIYSNNGMKDRVIAIYNTNTQSTNILQISKIAQNIETVTSTVEVNKQGKTVLTTNSVKEAKRMDQNVDKVISQIKSKHPEIKIEEIQTIQTVQQSATKQYTVIANTVDAKIEQITVSMSKQTKIIREIDLQIVNQQKLIITPLPLPKIEVKPKDYKNEEVSSLLQTIVIKQTSTVGNNPQIVKVEMQESYNEIAYTFILKNQQSKIDYTVKIQKDKTTDETIIADVRPTNNLQIIQKPVQQTYTETTVDQNTGVVITKTNDKETITSSQQTKNAITYLEKNVKEVKGLTVESIETRDYQITTQQTILYRVSENKGIQYTVLIQKSNQQITPIGNTEVDLVNDITKPSLPQIVQNVVTQSSFNVAVTNDKALTSAINVVGSTKPILKTEIPITTIIEDLSQFKKITLVYDVQGNKERITLIHNIKQNTSTFVESSFIATALKSSIIIDKVNENGLKSQITNNLVLASNKDKAINNVIDKITATNPEITIKNIQSIQTIYQTNTQEYTVISKLNNGQVEQVLASLNKDLNTIRVIDTQIKPQKSGLQVIHKPINVKETQLKKEDYKSQQVQSVLSFIKQQQPQTKNLDIQLIKTQETHLNKHYVIDLKNKENNQILKIELNLQQQSKKLQIADVKKVDKEFIQQKAIHIEEKVDKTTSVKQTIFNNQQTFKKDSNYQTILSQTKEKIPDINNYHLQSAIKKTYGPIDQYTTLYKSENHSPQQVTLALNKLNNQVNILNKKTITDDNLQLNLLNPTTPEPKTINLSNVQKENVKILSQLSSIPELPDYKDVENKKELQKDQTFIAATNILKTEYPILLKDSIVVKVLEKNQIDNKELKVFYKANDQIYEANIEQNHNNHQVSVKDFSKLGKQSTRSNIQIDVDLAFGYLEITDLKSDKNGQFLINYVKNKYSTDLNGASLRSVSSLALANGRINYKIIFKSDIKTIKYVIYYEPQYKRILQIRTYPFQVGQGYTEKNIKSLVDDPYFRKVDSFIKEIHSKQLIQGKVLKVETKDQGSKLIFRTIYSSLDKTYHSYAYIMKQTQIVQQQYWNEIIEVPTIQSDPKAQYKTSLTKLDTNDLSQNVYFAETDKYIKQKYTQQLKNSQMLGTTQEASLFSYKYNQYYTIGGQTYSVAANYEPLTQKIQIINEPKKINLKNGFSALKNDQKFSQIVQWLKRKDIDLENAVIIKSGQKPILFGIAFRVIFKALTKFQQYVVYAEGDSTQYKILHNQQYTDINDIPQQSTQNNLQPKPIEVSKQQIPTLLQTPPLKNQLPLRPNNLIKDDNCVSRYDDGGCKDCANGFHLFELNCYPQIKACVDYSGPSQCQSCEIGFNLKSNSCI